MIRPTKIFDVFYDEKSRLYTENLSPGNSVYGERLAGDNGREYREWNPKRSKLAAALMKGCPNILLRKGQTILYLGSSTGTTVSHVSDIVGKDGFIFALDIAPRVMRDLVFLAEQRKNICPILADANRPDTFSGRIFPADIVYQDVAQRNQVEIFLKNLDLFVKEQGYGLLALKARSINVAAKPREIFQQVKQQLEKETTIVDMRILDPFERDHAFFICKKK